MIRAHTALCRLLGRADSVRRLAGPVGDPRSRRGRRRGCNSTFRSIRDAIARALAYGLSATWSREGVWVGWSGTKLG